jgi:hypothetical protein
MPRAPILFFATLRTSRPVSGHARRKDARDLAASSPSSFPHKLIFWSDRRLGAAGTAAGGAAEAALAALLLNAPAEAGAARSVSAAHICWTTALGRSKCCLGRCSAFVDLLASLSSARWTARGISSATASASAAAVAAVVAAAGVILFELAAREASVARIRVALRTQCCLVCPRRPSPSSFPCFPVSLFCVL